MTNKSQELKPCKPTRNDLLIVISRLQDMVGSARGLHYNDRSQTAFEEAQDTLKEAFNLCVLVRNFDESEVKSRNGWDTF